MSNCRANKELLHPVFCLNLLLVLLLQSYFEPGQYIYIYVPWYKYWLSKNTAEKVVNNNPAYTHGLLQSSLILNISNSKKELVQV